jgi:phosphorylcholine metabolism protein LicD
MSGHQPVLSTEGAMVFSCMLRAVDMVAQKVGCPWYLHAGSALGAFVHGGPIPWDDDVDVIFDSACAHDFRLEMERFSVDDVKFFCRDSHDGFKITLDDERFR